MTDITRIVVGLEFDDTTEPTMKYAIGLAHLLGAEITAVHVYELPVYALPEGAWVPTAEALSQIADAAQAGVKAAIRPWQGHGVKIEGVVRQGKPADEIIEAARERKADLIVLGTHGRRGIAHAFFGSVAEKVVRASEIPVLTVHDAIAA
jgi:nucleotide-binding universal stress UspA family protein